MTVLALPDLKGAVIAHLRASSEIAALTSTRISARLQDSWPLPDYAILVQGPRGGLGDLDAGLYAERLDLRCFGPDNRTANLLWRTVNAYLLPPLRDRAVGFKQANTIVHTIQAEGGPIEFEDPETTWISNDSGYVFIYSTSPSP